MTLPPPKLIANADGSIDGLWFGVFPETPLMRQNRGAWSEQIPYSQFVPSGEERTLWIQNALLAIWGSQVAGRGTGALTVRTPGESASFPWRVLIPYFDGDNHLERAYAGRGIPLTKDDALCMQAGWESYADAMTISQMFGTLPTCKLQFSIQIAYRVG